jgi:hypothetical protein
VLLGLVALAAPTAHASGTQESIFQDDDRLLHSTPEGADATLAELRDLGVDRIRLSVIWKDLAPAHSGFDGADPSAYPAAGFDNLDHVLRVARRLNIAVLLNVRGGAPAWAMPDAPRKLAGRDGFRPSPAEYQKYTAMLGRRYDGTYNDENQGRTPLPRVTAWSVWNEPNWSGHLQPQSERNPRNRRLRTVAPRHYRKLYRAAVDALRATGHGDDTILIGETAPVGNSKHGELSHLKPLEFLRELFCLDSRLRPFSARRAVVSGCDFDRKGPLYATGYAHHPYSVVSPPAQPSADKDFATLADGDRLKTVLDAAAAAGRIPAGLPLWYTEFGYQTAPPDPFRGVTLDQQAQWLVDAEQLTSADPRIAALTQFLLADDEPRTSFAETDARRWATYQTGLEFQDGTAKPAYAAYRLPLRATPGATAEDPVALWGMVRPGANGAEQRIRIEFRPADQPDWRVLSERTVTDPRGYWTDSEPGMGPGFYRFEWLRPAAALAPAGPAGARLPGGSVQSSGEVGVGLG